MHKPLESVVALAHFTLQEESLHNAKALLEQESNWDRWLKHVELHGLSGFAAKHIREHKLPVPKSTVIGLGALVIRHKQAAKARYQTLYKVSLMWR